MALEQTLAIIKPDAIANKNIGKIIQKIEENDFLIRQSFMLQLAKEEVAEFYHAHTDKPFFDDLTSFMSSGTIIIMILEKENAIQDWRTLMGDTDPAKADKGTIRGDFSKSIDENTVHGSDSLEAAIEEITFFFDIDEDFEIEETTADDTTTTTV
jgi:nucleoside-diphosphate kinase